MLDFTQGSDQRASSQAPPSGRLTQGSWHLPPDHIAPLPSPFSGGDHFCLWPLSPGWLCWDTWENQCQLPLRLVPRCPRPWKAQPTARRCPLPPWAAHGAEFSGRFQPTARVRALGGFSQLCGCTAASLPPVRGPGPPDSLLVSSCLLTAMTLSCKWQGHGPSVHFCGAPAHTDPLAGLPKRRLGRGSEPPSQTQSTATARRPPGPPGRPLEAVSPACS